MSSGLTAAQLTAFGIDGAAAPKTAEMINGILAETDAARAWTRLRQEVLTPDQPFELHHHLFRLLTDAWDETKGPLPVWTPTEDDVEAANITTALHDLKLSDYKALHAWSTVQIEDFWAYYVHKAGVVFSKEPEQIADLSGGIESPRWLPGARMNIADSCFKAPGDRAAVVYRREAGASLEVLTYDQLNAWSNRVACGLVAAGFKPGDALAVDMTMTHQSVIIYLGIAKAGCKVVSIADSFSPAEIATRLRLSEAKGIFTMDRIRRGEKRLPMYAKVVEANAPRAIVIPLDKEPAVMLRDGDLWWDDFLSAETAFESVQCDPHDHVNILFSSGTTGDPKAIPWSHSTPIKAGMDGWFHHDIHAGDMVCWPTNLGWMMGPWLIFASLLNDATIALYEDAPTGRDFCEFVQDAGVTMLGVVPSIVKAWKNAGAVDGLDWSGIRAFSSTGECSNAEDMLFLMSRADYKPVIEYCGGTEIGGGYLCGTVVQAAAPSTFSTPALGQVLFLLDENHQAGSSGEVYLARPSMGLSLELLNKDHHKTYFQDTPPGPAGEQLRRHGDQLERFGKGYYRAQGRADDTMNLGGIKVGSAEIERVLKGVDGVDETAAVAVPPKGGGPSLLVLFAVLQAGVEPGEDLAKAMQKAIRANLNPLFKIHQVVYRETLPRTASGKVMRRVLRSEYLAART